MNRVKHLVWERHWDNRYDVVGHNCNQYLFQRISDALWTDLHPVSNIYTVLEESGIMYARG